MTALAHLRLLQMASQAFPVGGYSHSQGLEAAVDCGRIRDEAGVRGWITDMLEFTLLRYEIPCLQAMSAAWEAGDWAALEAANEEFLASRETAELRHASVQMGYSMRALLAVLPGLPAALMQRLEPLEEPSLPCVWSGAARAWSLDAAESAAAYLWSFAENQVLVAMKTVPIGQAAGQRVLLEVGARIAVALPLLSDQARAARSNFAPGLAIFSSQHETQYSRLFRS